MVPVSNFNYNCKINSYDAVKTNEEINKNIIKSNINIFKTDYTIKSDLNKRNQKTTIIIKDNAKL